MSRYVLPPDLAVQHWQGETTAVARLGGAGTTHLVAAEAITLIQAVAEQPQGLALREIPHALGLSSEADPEMEATLQHMLEGLVQSGLLCRADDDADPWRESPR